MRANVADLEGVILRQIVMRDVSVRDPTVEVLGQRLGLPIVLAPVGLAGMFARRAEVQAARAGEALGVPFVESTVSICSVEEGTDATTTPAWFQLYVMRDRGYAEDLMARAQAVGSPVLILTIDLAVVGARHRDTRNAVVGQPSAWAKVRRGLDLAAHPRWIATVALGGRPLTFGNLENAVPGGRSPAAFKAWVDAGLPVDAEQQLVGDRRLDVRVDLVDGGEARRVVRIESGGRDEPLVEEDLAQLGDAVAVSVHRVVVRVRVLDRRDELRLVARQLRREHRVADPGDRLA